ncbi:MAG TPA: gamma carbonic anhydrase family protein [Candidatus Krumholzibacterium sp.]|nr:gamma carbonic anhydrase family protein [Candidatus Krumholzibacterium sp.]
MIEDFQGFSPRIAPDVFVAPTASVIGDVSIGEGSSVWHSAAIRGDCWRISIGRFSNIQDGAVCHVTTGGPELIVGDYVTVGHNAVIHSCHIGDGALIGMGAVVLDGARIGEGSIVAAGSVVLEGTVIPPGSLVAGVPGAVRRPLAPDTIGRLRVQAGEYHELALSYMGKGEFKRETR